MTWYIDISRLNAEHTIYHWIPIREWQSVLKRKFKSKALPNLSINERNKIIAQCCNITKNTYYDIVFKSNTKLTGKMPHDILISKQISI